MLKQTQAEKFLRLLQGVVQEVDLKDPGPERTVDYNLYSFQKLLRRFLKEIESLQSSQGTRKFSVPPDPPQKEHSNNLLVSNQHKLKNFLLTGVSTEATPSSSGPNAGTTLVEQAAEDFLFRLQVLSDINPKNKL